jgi:hypothetical protein
MKTNKLVIAIVGAVAIIIMVLGGFLIYQNSLNPKNDDSLADQDKTTKTHVTPTKAVITEWTTFQDKDLYGLTFKYPKGSEVNIIKATPYNTVGDYIELNTGKLDAANPNINIFEIAQVVTITDTECKSVCKLENVKVLGKTITLDTSNGSNDKLIPVNPRLRNSGVDGYIQLRISNEYVQDKDNQETLRKILESMEYN